MMSSSRLFFLTICWFLSLASSGQENRVMLHGTVLSPDKQPLAGVNIQVKNSSKGTFSDQKGNFSLSINQRKDSLLIISCLNYNTLTVRIDPDNKKSLQIILAPQTLQLSEVEINRQRSGPPGTTHIDPLLAIQLTNSGSGAIEQLVKTLPGVSSHNELTPQYSVRGGNYDENLLYVNGIEIFRPFLVKTGEQEGLSFLNPDLVSKIRFSSGGFESSYGDKMSSVLDIDYKTPEKRGGSAEIGALGGSLHLEGRAIKDKLSYLTGVRYRDNRYLLGTLDQKGHYDPACFDLQAFIGYDFSSRFSMNFLTNIASNHYTFTPETRETRYGTMSQAYLLKIYFEGHEKDLFSNKMGALSVNYHPGKRLNLQLTASSFQSDETERYDILGQYYLNEILSASSGGNNPDSSLLLGVGSSLRHAGNYLHASIQNLEQKGVLKIQNHSLQWGIKYQREKISNQLNEWEMRDSAGYSLPYNNQSVALYSSINSRQLLQSNRLSAFLQDNFTFHLNKSLLTINMGGRLQYWDFNHQTIFSPRVSLLLVPNPTQPIQWHLAFGIYQQMPFFKELIDRKGQLYSNIKAQKSIHYLIGMDRSFQWGDHPFKFSTELWYKSLHHLIPYKVTNLDLQYFPEEQSHGYAGGFEMKIYGEPIPGATSWASLTLMKTEEDIIGDSYQESATKMVVYPGYLPRPSDQRFNFSLFFQDFLPKNPSLKMNLTLLYGSKLPFGPPHAERWMDRFQMPAYKRVDVGFSKMLIGSTSKNKNFFTRNLIESWFSMEIFNLFGLDNTISYYWVSDFENQMHAVPNYLTGRRINLKLSVKF